MSTQQEPVSLDLDRRSFMKASALAGTVALGAGGVGHALTTGEEVDATDDDATEYSKTICNYCSVGCGFRGEREGDAFVGMEPWEEHPVNAGSLCSKGAGILETEHSEKRVKRPMIMEDGEWRTLSWDNAYSRLGDDIKALWPDHELEDAPDIPEEDVNLSRESIMILGSAHHSNEEAYASRKLAAFMGTNNIDHQARICHSTTVSGLANTWGYGAMTQPINDYRNFDLNIIIGQNPAEAHPVAMQHILEGQRRGGTIVNVDPRYTKTSAHADYFYRLRPGTDVALMMGLVKYIRDQGELAMGGEDATGQNMIDERTVGWPDVEAELDNYDLDTVADITWIDREDLEELGDLIIENSPHVQIEWAMGSTQHNNGTQNIRSFAITSLASGSSARSGGGLQVMRGHANVQGATDLAVASHILPGYYGLTAGGWAWWADVWDHSPYVSGSTSFEDLYNKFELMPPEKYVRQQPGEQGPDPGDLPGDVDETDASDPAENSMMFQNGLTVARWFEAALDQEDRMQETPIYQPEQVKIAMFWGHSSNSISEMRKMKQGMENLDLLVVIDVFPSLTSVLPDHEEGPPVLLLPASSQYEHYRSLTNSHRATQWSEPVAPPAHSSRPDLRIMQELADELGFGEHFDWGNGTEIHNGKSSYEDVIREFNLGTNTIGYRQSPERIQQHMENAEYFDQDTLRAPKDIDREFAGDYWMLPWPCWGEEHPGTPIIWNDDLDPRDGGQDFRTRWGPTAPGPDDWAGDDYPLQETYDQYGEEGLDMTRDTYEPDWLDEVNDELPGRHQINEVIGIPEYPGWKTTLPESIVDPEQSGQSDELTIPQQYALDPTASIADAARAMDPDTNTDIYGASSKSRIYDEFTDRGATDDELHRAFKQHIADQGIDADTYAEYDNDQPDAPTGRGRARMVVWSFLDTVPVHREPIESPRADLVEDWPANGQQRNFYRLDQNNRTEQQAAMQRLADAEGSDAPMNTIMTTGRQVEHQGGGAETRSNRYTADLQPHMYAEMTPNMAEDLGIDGGDLVVVSTTDRGSVLVKARVTDRPNDQEVFLPYHWGGVFQGESLEDKFPDGHVPYAIGDSANSITTRGYDVETQMQETKAAMVTVRPATQELVDELNMDVNLAEFEFPQDRNNIGAQKDFDVRDNTTTQ